MRLSSLLNRLVLLAVVAFVGSTSLTFAAGGAKLVPQQGPDPELPLPEKEAKYYIVVPDVRRQAYVFAKGMLEDAGFAWRVEGPVEGYATNLVVSQSPASRARVLDTGAPEIVLRLGRNPDYEEQGLPENASPFGGTAVVLASGERLGIATLEAEKSARETPGAKPKKPAAARKKTKASGATLQSMAKAKIARPPAFDVPGAPPEPRDEMTLTARARMIAHRMATEEPSKKLVKWWLYQHAWVVTGAKFGWHDGD